MYMNIYSYLYLLYYSSIKYTYMYYYTTIICNRRVIYTIYIYIYIYIPTITTNITRVMPICYLSI